ncbi:unnamed protein product [Chrysoparadoxa australica]
MAARQHLASACDGAVSVIARSRAKGRGYNLAREGRSLSTADLSGKRAHASASHCCHHGLQPQKGSLAWGTPPRRAFGWVAPPPEALTKVQAPRSAPEASDGVRPVDAGAKVKGRGWRRARARAKNRGAGTGRSEEGGVKRPFGIWTRLLRPDLAPKRVGYMTHLQRQKEDLRIENLLTMMKHLMTEAYLKDASRANYWKAAMDILMAQRARHKEGVLQLAGGLPEEAYQMTLMNLAKCKRADEALEILRLMESDVVTPSCTSYNYVMTALCGAKRDVSEVLEMFQEMKGIGLEPNGGSFSCMLHAFVNHQMTEEAMQLLHETAARGIELECSALLRLANLCSRKNLSDEALEVCEALIGKKMLLSRADEVHQCSAYSILVRALAFKGEFKKAREVLEATPILVMPSFFGRLVRGLFRHSGIDEAQKAVDLAVSYRSFVEDQKKQGEKALLSRRPVGAHENEAAPFLTFMRCATEPRVGGEPPSPARALRCFDTLVKEGVTPCVETVKLALDCCRRGPKSEGTHSPDSTTALDIYRALQKLNIPITPRIYEMIFLSLVRASKSSAAEGREAFYDSALEVYNDMAANKSVPGPTNAMQEALAKCRAEPASSAAPVEEVLRKVHAGPAGGHTELNVSHFEELEQACETDDVAAVVKVLGEYSKEGRLSEQLLALLLQESPASRQAEAAGLEGFLGTPKRYAQAMQMLLGTRRYDDVLLLWQQLMNRDRQTIPIKAYNLAMDAYNKLGKCQEVIALMQEIDRLQIQGDHLTYSAVLQAAASAGHKKAAVKFWGLMEQSLPAGISLQPEQLDSVLHMLLHLGEARQAYRWMKEYRGVVLASYESYMAVFKRLCSAGDHRGCLELLQWRLRESGLYPRDTAAEVALCLGAAARAGSAETSQRLWETVQEEGVLLDLGMFSDQMEKLFKARLPDEVLVLYLHFHKHFRGTITSSGDKAQAERIEHWFTEAQKHASQECLLRTRTLLEASGEAASGADA